MNLVAVLAGEFNLKPEHIENIINLIDEGNTLPFIARYRKELTGSIDDQVLRELSDRLNYLRNLEKRREEIAAWEDMTIEEHMDYYEKQGMDNKTAMKQVAKDRGVGKREIYQHLHKES